MKVAHLTTIDMSLALLLATELRVRVDEGYEVLGISAPGPFVRQVEELGVRFVPVPSLTRRSDPRHDALAITQLVAVLRRERPLALHTHTPKGGLLGRLAGQLAGIPVIVNTQHGIWADRDAPWLKRLVVVGAEALAAQLSDAELYQNDEDRRRLSRYVRRRKARTVGNGVDLARFQRDHDAGLRVREEWGIGPDEVLVGGVGRRVAEKGIAEFGAAARSLAGTARFVWVGPDDPDKPDALRQVEEGITTVAFRTDMPAVYSAFDVFCLPSHREGFSRSGMEAAACGCGLVLSDIRGCRDLGRDGRDLVLVPPRNPGALARALNDLIHNPARRRQLQQAAADRARNAFDQRAVAVASIEAYRRAAARARPAAVERAEHWCGR